VVVREVRPAEYEEAGGVTALAWREFVPHGNERWEGYLRRIGDVAARAERTPVLVAVDGERILGTVTLELDRRIDEEPSWELDPSSANIRMLGVDPAARGRGAGRALVEACIERARSAGKEVVTLHTQSFMKAAIALYESMGFVRDPPRDRTLKEEGITLTAYRMEL
jgi:ribosomal protein S18 acetylase RimI-like enzyme